MLLLILLGPPASALTRQSAEPPTPFPRAWLVSSLHGSWKNSPDFFQLVKKHSALARLNRARRKFSQIKGLAAAGTSSGRLMRRPAAGGS
ncbi:unnamed protein product [Ciceribacter selenitireducens ATCC BAA-1503]|uniref:Uncharacterized protein n=1 Tax=Ciceribacter selenitireducens ATCC BAA-1503 TaxID=1336235 RepID=A0A376ADN4_9HYPH|nr:unnamed protein product [Ciceribacter selenitireducens ATCC BAA-1503]